MTSANTISVMIVEDNARLRIELSDYLREEGFIVTAVSDGEELNIALEHNMPSIVILDLNLPGEDGIAIATRLRTALPGIGVIMLTARVRSIDRNEGYAAGADVYLTKPTSPDEIVQVIKNLQRRLTPPKTPLGWVLDTEKSLVILEDGSQLALTSLENLLIKELVLHGKFISHDDLIYYLGDHNESAEFNKSRIEVLISRVRKKVSVFTDPNLFIKVIRGRGYQLIKPITLKNLAPSGKSPHAKSWR
jgi:DNA-binding response OmpR family regulator